MRRVTQTYSLGRGRPKAYEVFHADVYNALKFVLELLEARGYVTVRDLVKELGWGKERSRKLLVALRELGLLREAL